MMLATQAQIAAMEGTVGQAAHMAFPGGLASDGRRPPGGSVPAGAPFLATRQEYFWASADDPGGDRSCCSRAATGGWRRSRRCWSPR